MDDILSLLGVLNLNYLRAQLVLLPLTVVYLLVRGHGMSLRHRVRLHDWLLGLSLALPAVVSFTGLLPPVHLSSPVIMPARWPPRVSATSTSRPRSRSSTCSAGMSRGR
jgi:hypothetical protein